MHLGDTAKASPAHQDDGQSLLSKPDFAEIEQVSSRALRPGNANEVMVRSYGITLRRRDLWTLDGHAWLNDQVCYNDFNV